MKHFHIFPAIAFAATVAVPATAQNGPEAQAEAQAEAPAAAAAEAVEAAPAEATSPYAVAVEPLSLGKGKGGFMTVAFSTAGYNFSSSTSVQSGGGTGIKIFGVSKSKEKVVVKYRVLKDGQPFDAGTCSVTAKIWSGLWNSTENTLYTCNRKPDGIGPADFALEAAVPDIPLESGDTIALSSAEPIDYAVLKARMRYDGVVYEALPTELDIKQAERRMRAAKGWLITRDGKPVGRLDFAPRDKGVDVLGSLDRKSIITAPVNAADGREAVITFAAHLMFLPEANTPLLETD